MRDAGAIRYAALPLTLIVGVAGAVLQASDLPVTKPDTSQWTCDLCPFAPSQVTAVVEVGAAYVSDSAARFGDYRGLEERGAYGIGDGALRLSPEDGVGLTAAVVDAGLAARQLRLAADQPGHASVELGYRVLPHYLSDTVSTPFLQSGNRNELPDDWIRAGATTGMTRLADSAMRSDWEFERRTAEAEGRWHISPQWNASFGYRHDERIGRDAIGAAFVNLGAQIPQPVDDRTHSVDAALAYAGDLGAGQLAYYGSYFSNASLALDWRNPFIPVVEGADIGRLALAPDNSFHQAQLSWTQRVGRHTRWSVRAAYGEARQNAAFLPYTSNVELLGQELPRDALDGKVSTTYIDLRLNTDLRAFGELWRGARLVVDAQIDDRNDRTPTDLFERVESDSFIAAAAINRPYDFERRRMAVRLDYDLRRLLPKLPASQRLSLAGGWRYESFDRPQRQVRLSRERSGWARIAYVPRPWLTAQLELGTGMRESGGYRSDIVDIARQNPLLRQYDLADRDTERAEFKLSAAPTTDWGVSLTTSYASHAFVNSPLGLMGTRTRDATFTAHRSVGANTTMDIRAGWGRRTAAQLGSQAFSQPDWSVKTEDQTRSAGAALRLAELAGRFDLVLDYSYVESDGGITTDPGVLPIAGFPALRHRMDSASLRIDYQHNARWSIHAELVAERYAADDFALDAVAFDSIPTFLTQGARTLDYDLRYIALSFRYRSNQEARVAR